MELPTNTAPPGDEPFDSLASHQHLLPENSSEAIFPLPLRSPFPPGVKPRHRQRKPFEIPGLGGLLKRRDEHSPVELHQNSPIKGPEFMRWLPRASCTSRVRRSEGRIPAGKQRTVFEVAGFNPPESSSPLEPLKSPPLCQVASH